MASLIPGYEYDIFISYRQKDNKGDRWVSEFVEALKTELESTFKEEISVYFDINPHDGLLETHDVDASLKEKLKCLVFIPIISRTYCDPNSFAWEHEFKAFVEQASEDQFGLKVRLSNGNVSSRVLPVRIHELDNEDIKLCELILGGVLRGVEFIYRSPGVNRPLRSKEERPNDNLNNTIYRDQVNKVANAIKEIVLGIKTGEVVTWIEKPADQMPWEEIKKEQKIDVQKKPDGSNKQSLLSGIATLVIAIVLVAIFIYPKIFKRDTLERLRSSGERISVAVIPFQNMTNDTAWNVWQDGIQFNLITSLSDYSDELKVRQSESTNSLIKSNGIVNYTSITPSLASTISQKLDAKIFIYGNISQSGSTIRLNAQLVDSKSEETYKSFTIDGIAKNILNLVDSLSMMVKNSLIIAKIEKELPLYLKGNPTTSSPEAYKLFLYGENARNKRDYPTARNMFSQALEIDSNFTLAMLMLSTACINQGDWEEARKWSVRVYEKREQMPIKMQILTNQNHAVFFETPYEELKYLRQYLEIDDQNPETYYDIGRTYYFDLYQYNNAIPEFEKSLEIYHKLDLKPRWIFNYSLLGWAYYETGQNKKIEKLIKKADKDFPDDALLTHLKAVIALKEGDTIAANKYIEQYRSVRKDNGWSEAGIAYNIGEIYFKAGNLEKAEEYHRLELSLEPDDAIRIYDLGWFLIYSDRNINEGLELIDKALDLRPDLQWFFLEGKGWGLYKQGKYKESLELLEKCKDLSLYYRQSINLKIEEVKKLF